MRTPPEQAIDRELAVIGRAYQRAERAIMQARDVEGAFRAADQLAGNLRVLYDTGATRLVSRSAMRLREARRYSLVELARAVNVSKQRASQWAAREQEGE
jgi:hypothetical protein